MLEFASLFLGLVWGYQPIEMVVGDPHLVKMEFRVDGKRQVVLEGPPWKTAVDFGSLAPRRLEVLGFGADGARLAHAEQWINVPRASAEARLVVEQDDAGRKTHAVLKWESVAGDPPVRKVVEFDGKVLPPAPGDRYQLPPADGSQLHFLTAELVFPDDSTAHAEVSFGGLFGDEVEAELTAFPVRVVEEGAPTEPLFSCLSLADGTPLRVAQVERGAAEVIFVRDRGAEVVINRLRFLALSNKMPQPRMNRKRSLHDDNTLRYEMLLEEEDRLRFVWPNLIETDHPNFKKSAFFESSAFFTPEDGGIFYFLSFLYPDKPDGPQHLSDALALAGLRAAAEGRRRAVVMVLGGLKPQDRSAQLPAVSQAFLQSLDVPLHVWSGAPPGKAAKDWPPSRHIGNVEAVRQAVDELRRDLDSQRIVWIAGRYLAPEIHLDRQRCPAFAPLFPRPEAAAGPAAAAASRSR